MCVLIKSDIHCQLSLLNVAMLHSPMIIVVLDKNEIFLMCVKLPFADVCQKRMKNFCCVFFNDSLLNSGNLSSSVVCICSRMKNRYCQVNKWQITIAECHLMEDRTTKLKQEPLMCITVLPTVNYDVDGVCVPFANSCMSIKLSICVLIKSDICCRLSLLKFAIFHSLSFYQKRKSVDHVIK